MCLCSHVQYIIPSGNLDTPSSCYISCRGHTEEVPEYSSTQIPRIRRVTGTGRFDHEHRFALHGNSGHVWLSLEMRSRAADSKHNPLSFKGDRINGVVHLDLIKTETLKGLTLTESRYA